MPAETAANALSDPDKLAVVIAEDGQAAGFRDYGLRRMGGEGLQKILQYQLGRPQAAAAMLHLDSDRETLLREYLTGIFAQSKLLADLPQGPLPGAASVLHRGGLSAQRLHQVQRSFRRTSNRGYPEEPVYGFWDNPCWL